MKTLPQWWHGAGFDARAWWLVDSHWVKDYSAACRWLREKKKPTPKEIQTALKFL